MASASVIPSEGQNNKTTSKQNPKGQKLNRGTLILVLILFYVLLFAVVALLAFIDFDLLKDNQLIMQDLPKSS